MASANRCAAAAAWAAAGTMLLASCAAVGASSGEPLTATPSPGSAHPRANPATRKAGPAAPAGLTVLVNSRGMTVSWLAVDGANDGYAVSVDGAWHLVSGLKIHFPQILPGLPYHVQVAAVRGNRLGRISETHVDPDRGPRPTVPMTPTASRGPDPFQAPQPDPAVAAAAAVPELPGAAAVPPSPSPGPADMAPTDTAPTDTAPTDTAPTDTELPVTGVPVVSAITGNGCGFAPDGSVNFRVTVWINADAARAPDGATDTQGRLYVRDDAATAQAAAALAAGNGGGTTTGTTGGTAGDSTRGPAGGNTLATAVVVLRPLPGGKTPRRTTIQRLLITGAHPADDSGLDVPRVRWGTQLCTPQPRRPHW